jgi:hypothetical protein
MFTGTKATGCLQWELRGTTGSEWEFQRKVRGTKAEELIHWRKSQEISMKLRRNVREKRVRIGSKC